MTDMLKVLSNTADGVFAINSENQISSLTTREIEILRLIAQCRASKDIADKLCISHRTVRTHIQNILEKLQVHSML
ncbi:MAG: response regulator transcription factor [Nitrospirae bacterium]|nr:response regulator transcription factor [Nitrospirota bacterium]